MTTTMTIAKKQEHKFLKTNGLVVLIKQKKKNKVKRKIKNKL